jgi:Archaeal holliday junction resolvase (hjc)
MYLVEYEVNICDRKQLYGILLSLPVTLYTWSRFGREAEYVVALYLKSSGWNVALSRGSRGPADIIASCGNAQWFIQVKSSAGVPRLRGYEIRRLKEMAASHGGLPVISTLQPFQSGFNTGNYSILFYMLDTWQNLDPASAT